MLQLNVALLLACILTKGQGQFVPSNNSALTDASTTTEKIEDYENPEENILKTITNHIELHEFEEANEKLGEQFDLSTIANWIVKSLYNNDSVNFELLIDFSKSSKNLTISYSILKALWSELAKHDQLNLNNTIAMYKTFRSEVTIKLDNLKDNLKIDASQLQTMMSKSIINKSSHIISQPIFNESYNKTNTINDLVISLFNLDEDLGDETMVQVIDDVYDFADKLKLIDFLFYNRSTQYIAEGVAYMLRKLKSNGHVNDSAIVKLGPLLRWQKDHSSSDLSIKKNNTIQAAINDLPNSVRALAFAKNVCIRNVNSSTQFIYVINKKYDKKRRYVISAEKGLLANRKLRALHSYDTLFKLISSAYNELLYADDRDVYKTASYRKVFTWIHKYATTDQFRWIIELHGNEVTIKNKLSLENLCQDLKILDNDGVFTNINNPDSNESNCRWIIEEC